MYGASASWWNALRVGESSVTSRAVEIEPPSCVARLWNADAFRNHLRRSRPFSIAIEIGMKSSERPDTVHDVRQHD